MGCTSKHSKCQWLLSLAFGPWRPRKGCCRIWAGTSGCSLLQCSSLLHVLLSCCHDPFRENLCWGRLCPHCPQYWSKNVWRGEHEEESPPASTMLTVTHYPSLPTASSPQAPALLRSLVVEIHTHCEDCSAVICSAPHPTPTGT